MRNSEYGSLPVMLNTTMELLSPMPVLVALTATTREPAGAVSGMLSDVTFGEISGGL